MGAEVERERRAKVVAAEGEYQAAQRLADAAAIMAKESIALQLRFLQTLVEIASENNSTTIFPVPVDILKPFLSTKADRTAETSRSRGSERRSPRPAADGEARELRAQIPARTVPDSPPWALAIRIRTCSSRARS